MSAVLPSRPAEDGTPGGAAATAGATHPSPATAAGDPAGGVSVLTVTVNPALDWTLEVPGLTVGAVNRAASASVRPGGKGVNVATALALAGHAVAATGFLGRDNERPFTDRFAALRISDHFVRLPGATRIGVKLVDPRADSTTDVNLPGLEPDAVAQAELKRRIEAIPCAWLAIGGSLPPGFAPATLATLIAARRASGGAVALDATGAALRAGLAAGATVIKPNQSELEELIGRPLPEESDVILAARQLLADHPALESVLASLGAEGACLISRESAVLARPPKMRVHSTVGAGDALLAGFIAARLRALDPAESLRLATGFAIATLARAAGDPRGQRPPESLAQDVTLRVAP